MFQTKVEELVDKFFPIKTFVTKDTDDPWVTEWLKKKIKRRNKEYKMNGKSELYSALKKEIELDFKTLKKAYFEGECAKLSKNGSHRISFSALKNLNCPSRPSPWNVLQLYQGVSEEVALETLADYFNEISSEFEGLEECDLPTTYDRDIYDISESDILLMLQKIKKPKTFLRAYYPWSTKNALCHCTIYSTQCPRVRGRQGGKKSSKQSFPRRLTPQVQMSVEIYHARIFLVRYLRPLSYRVCRQRWTFQKFNLAALKGLG